ncbi:uncharacterized protein V6R79_000783 [Siganus canaliculatus]
MERYLLISLTETSIRAVPEKASSYIKRTHAKASVNGHVEVLESRIRCTGDHSAEMLQALAFQVL